MRTVRCVRGELSFAIVLAPRFAYGREPHEVALTEDGIAVVPVLIDGEESWCVVPREVFTAAALLLVIGIALLMTQVGLSPALGKSTRCPDRRGARSLSRPVENWTTLAG